MKVIRKIFFYFLRLSLISSSKARGLSPLLLILKEAVPNIKEQYSSYIIDSEYLTLKARCLHSFQIKITQRAISLLKKQKFNVVDIGDSSGTHLRYLSYIYPKAINALSVNIDPIAVKKIKAKGLKAIHTSAEKLSQHPEFKDEEVDVFLSFETLEHLFSPIDFLSSLSSSKECNSLVITVPFQRKSKVGLHQLRNNPDKRQLLPENTHIFELCPKDWRLIFEFSGWEVIEEDIYFQYPPFWHPLYFFKYIWKIFDFEGFYGVILRPSKLNKRYLHNWD